MRAILLILLILSKKRSPYCPWRLATTYSVRLGRQENAGKPPCRGAQSHTRDRPTILSILLILSKLPQSAQFRRAVGQDVARPEVAPHRVVEREGVIKYLTVRHLITHWIGGSYRNASIGI